MKFHLILRADSINLQRASRSEEQVVNKLHPESCENGVRRKELSIFMRRWIKALKSPAAYKRFCAPKVVEVNIIGADRAIGALEGTSQGAPTGIVTILKIVVLSKSSYFEDHVCCFREPSNIRDLRAPTHRPS
ncbi:hypothetical protein TNCV_3835251 [Trichonephila clavipes]|nr:hypothetical protein TNCV_3835251 [Trichonephila clavipes]